MIEKHERALMSAIDTLTKQRDAYAAAADDMAAAHKVERDALKDAAKLALDALERILYKDCGEPAFFKVREAIAALKAVL